jgi:hypothetical protein
MVGHRLLRFFPRHGGPQASTFFSGQQASTIFWRQGRSPPSGRGGRTPFSSSSAGTRPPNWNRCWDLKNIFAEKFGGNNGVFLLKLLLLFAKS